LRGFAFLEVLKALAFINIQKSKTSKRSFAGFIFAALSAKDHRQVLLDPFKERTEMQKVKAQLCWFYTCLPAGRFATLSAKDHRQVLHD